MDASAVVGILLPVVQHRAGEEQPALLMALST
jgi:hypothetical protein